MRIHIVKFRLPHYADHHRHIVHATHTTLFGTEFFEGHGVIAIIAGFACLLGVVSYFAHIDP